MMIVLPQYETDFSISVEKTLYELACFWRDQKEDVPSWLSEAIQRAALNQIEKAMYRRDEAKRQESYTWKATLTPS